MTTAADEHMCAIARAYELVESSQGQPVGSRIDDAEREAVRHRWTDVQVVLSLSRVLGARDAGTAYRPHLRRMRALAADDSALQALALAADAAMHAGAGSSTAEDQGAVRQLIRAIATLDDAGGLVVHRAAALHQTAVAAHELGLWELAIEFYALAEKAFADDGDQRWRPTSRRMSRAIAFNRTELLLDWASAHGAIGDWAGAGQRAASGRGPDWSNTDVRLPRHWLQQYRAHLALLAAFVEAEPDSRRVADAGPPAVTRLVRAIHAARAGEAATAANLAEGLDEQLGDFVPSNTRLLALSIAARHPASRAAAVRYADTLARLRWEVRIDRLAGIRDAIAVERRRDEHEQLRRQAYLDELTGLGNRRRFQTYLSDVCVDGSTEYAVMMIDVDHFKEVNDRFGHDAGDLVLATIAEILSSHVRPVDLAARLGGDEFAVIMACDAADGVPEERGQRIVEAVRDYPWNRIASGLAVSISVGLHRGEAEALLDVKADADRELYRAKHGGRGRLSAS